MDAVDQLEILGRLAMAAALGGFIGLERELRGYPAGIRTMALITMGAMHAVHRRLPAPGRH